MRGSIMGLLISLIIYALLIVSFLPTVLEVKDNTIKSQSVSVEKDEELLKALESLE